MSCNYPAPCCCCVGSCLLVSDTFGRADSTTIGVADTAGGTWTEVAGAWEVSSNQLYETGTANAILINSQINEMCGRGSVSARIFPTGGEKYRLIVNYGDAQNYQYVEFHTTSSSVVITAGSQSRTYTTSDGWDITTRPMSIRCFLDDGFLYAGISHLGLQGCVWDNTVSLGSGRLAGMGNGGTTPLYFDNFSHYEHYLDDPACPDHGCYCLYDDGGQQKRHYISWKLRLDYYTEPDDCCGEFHGGYANLEYNCEFERWDCVSGSVAGVSLPQSNAVCNRSSVLPNVGCGSPDLSQFELNHPFCCDSHSDPYGHGGCCDIRPNSSQSDPFSLRWDFSIPNGDLSCGYCGWGCPGGFWVIATEA